MVDATIKKLISAIADQINLVVSWKEELRRLKNRLIMIQALLQDAGERQVTQPAVKLWLERLRDAASDADDVLDEVAYENLKRKIEIQNHMKRKVCYFFSLSNPFISRMKMAKKIEKIVASVDDINKEAQGFGLQTIPVVLDLEHRRRNLQTHSFCDVSQVVGRDGDVSRIVELLTDSTNQLPLWVLSIVGMGGLGKTTLAQSVRNNEHIKKDFAKIIWVCVSENFDVERILKEILESVTGRACGNIINVDTVIQNIQNELAGKNYLLILDDVWDLESQKWEELRRSLLGMGKNSRSRIVVTTREERVASIANHKHHLKELEDDECLSIIKQRAFGDSPIPSHLGLEVIANEIAKKCRGVPLVANVIGGTLQNNMSKDYWLSIKNMNAWELPEGECRILSILRLSFDRLPESALKQCFAFCSIFPKDYVMEKEILIELWMAEGIIQSPEGSCKSMEDIETKIKELPKAISKLYNLQAFRFMDCEYLKMPLKGIGYLINLRHIRFSDVERMPANIGRLTSLQTLPSFYVGTRKGCKIEELGSLSRLKGGLEILNLELVKDKSEAEGAKLYEKAIDELRLLWDSRRELELESNHDEEVLEGLQPHSNLQRLVIDNYGGENLPSWMLSSNELFSPNNFNLVKLSIRSCRKLNGILVISGLSSLKQLTICYCSELTSVVDGAFEKFSLEQIKILDCPKLQSLRATCLPGLKELCIGGFLKELELEESLNFNCIHHIHASLEKLSLFDWDKLTQLPHQIQHLTALRELQIWEFRKLDALPEWLGNLSSLESLEIMSCQNLKCLPSAEAVRRLTKLKRLRIRDCPGLMESCAKETGAEWPKISHIPYIYLW
ncbi:hypothetical protein SLEP1_g46671 [Rubroshorea leprosula]|uniref:Disease resistance protein RGA3 n=1 Tax=Rubroshorea leprosula TaxID=152421 RepID=A0AAV5LPM8_9ROSI|nr:hypothetical protein SLEP1_g46671 [Rubroshorea leprosula]